MADKNVEVRCLEKILAAPHPKGNSAELVYNLLSDAIIMSDMTQEAPDFVLGKQDVIIGLEHFLVDVLITNSGSNARMVNKRRQQVLHGKKPSHKDLRRINALPEVQQKLKNGILLFNEQQFLRELQRVSQKHGMSVKGYRADIRKYGGKEHLIGAMIEMPCQTNGSFVLHYSNGSSKTRILNCVPLTQNMVSIMQRTLKDFDFVIILAETLLNELPRDAKVYCIWKNDFAGAIKEQRIPVCTSFTVRLEEETYEQA